MALFRSYEKFVKPWRKILLSLKRRKKCFFRDLWSFPWRFIILIDASQSKSRYDSEQHEHGKCAPLIKIYEIDATWPMKLIMIFPFSFLLFHSLFWIHVWCIVHEDWNESQMVYIWLRQNERWWCMLAGSTGQPSRLSRAPHCCRAVQTLSFLQVIYYVS